MHCTISQRTPNGIATFHSEQTTCVRYGTGRPTTISSRAPPPVEETETSRRRVRTCNTVHIVFILGRDLHERLVRIDRLAREVQLRPPRRRDHQHKRPHVKPKHRVPQPERRAPLHPSYHHTPHERRGRERERGRGQDRSGAEEHDREPRERGEVDDRALVRAREAERVRCLEDSYRRWEVDVSDHRPGSAALDLTVKKVDWARPKRKRTDVLRDWGSPRRGCDAARGKRVVRLAIVLPAPPPPSPVLCPLPLQDVL